MFDTVKRRITATTSAAALLAAGTLALAPAGALAQNASLPAPLQQVPADAQVVIMVPSLQGLSDKIAQFSQNIGVNAPQTQNLLQQFKQQMGLSAGVNDQGAMLVVVSNLAQALQTHMQPDYAMLVPVSDFKAFVGNFDGSDAGNGLTELSMPDGQPGYAKEVAGYAVISPNQSVVEGYAAGGDTTGIAQKIGSLGQKYLAEGDFSVYVDMASLGETLKPMLDQQMQQLTMMAEMMGGQGGMQAQNMKNLTAMYAVLGDALVDSTGIVKSIAIDGDAASLNFAIQGKPDSAFTQLFPGGEAQTQPLLSALPSKPFIVSTAVDASVINLSKIAEGFTQAMDDSPMGQMYAQLQPMMKSMRGYSMAFYAPTDAMAVMNGGLMNVVNIYAVDDAEQFKGQVKQYLQAMNGMSQEVQGMAPNQNGQAPSISWTTQWSDSEMQIQGIEIDSYQVQTNLPPEVMNQMGQMGPMMAALGGTGYSGLVAAVDNRVIMTTVRDPQLMTSALETVRGGQGLGVGQLQQVQRDQVLPPNPFAEGYLSITGLASTVSQFMAMMGAQPINPPADLPPVSVGAGMQDTGVALKIHIPARSVQFVVNTAMQMQQQMQQQGGGGFGPQPAPNY